MSSPTGRRDDKGAAASTAAAAKGARPYRPTRAEQETVIRWDREDDQVHLWSSSPVTWRKLERLGFRPIRETTCQGEVSGRFYRIPLNRFRWGLKRAGARAPGRRVAVRKAA